MLPEGAELSLVGSVPTLRRGSVPAQQSGPAQGLGRSVVRSWQT